MKLLSNLPSAILALSASMLFMQAQAQLSSNPDKFLGNITTSGQVDYGDNPFHTMWNQITPENESKWESVERTKDKFNWGSDKAYNYAKDHNFPFKFHCLVWGSQYPSWVKNLSAEERYNQIEEWMDAVKQRYPDLQLIDVVNEAITGHQADTYLFEEALGGSGRTGYDWIIKAFEMAHDRWPDAILIYNDFNTFKWQRAEFIDIVRTLRDAGAPIDAYGCQSHDLTDMDEGEFKSSMDLIQRELQIPMYITEYDIASSNDDYQLKRYKEQVPYMWEADYCAGVTLWGYIYGKTWIDNGSSGIIKNGIDRPAMTWLREYMQTDKAKQAKSPFPGKVKEASIYVKPSALEVAYQKAMTIKVDARLKTKTIDHIDLYVKGEKVSTLTAAPYSAEYTPAALGKYDVKAVVVATDGTAYTRLSGFTAKDIQPREPFDGIISLPGIIEAENFDKGGEGYSYHDSDAKDEGASGYRTDNGGLDIGKGNGGYVLGYTAKGEWTEYTVDVTEAGEYEYIATVSSGADNSGFSLTLWQDDNLVRLTNKINVPNGGSWDIYKTVSGKLLHPLQKGEQVIRLTIDAPYCNIDKIEFKNSASGIHTIEDDTHDGDATYSLTGQRVGSGYQGFVIRNGKKLINR